MHITRRACVAAAVAIGVLWFAAQPRIGAQNRKNYSILNDQSGHAVLGLALRKLNVAGTFMQCPAHPDDESNGLLAYYGYGQGLRVIDLQNNRGEGGQNEIGPELFRDMGVLRTSELLAAHRIDGAEQYFTRAIDYGYSFDPQEVIRFWGREDIVGDYVRLFRTLRPDVVLTMNIQGSGGDRAHEATTVLVREAFRAAGDPSKYPDQIKSGLRAWQPSKLYFAGGGGGGRGGGGAANTHVARVDTSAYDALLGRTYTEIAADARSNHKCQGVGSAPPGIAGGGRGGPGGGGGYSLVDTTIPSQNGQDETSLMDGVDVSLAGLARFAGPNPPVALASALAGIANQAARAKTAFDSGNDAGTVAPLEAGLAAVRALRANLASMGLKDDARYEIDFRLGTNESNFQDAVIAAHVLNVDAVADDGLVIAGQSVRVTVAAVNRGATDVTVNGVEVSGFDGGHMRMTCAGLPMVLKKDATFSCTAAATIPRDAKPTEPYFTDDYWKHQPSQAINKFDPAVPFGVPFAPSPFRVVFQLKAGSVDVQLDRPIEYRYVKDLYFGDKRMEVNVVPAFSVKMTPTLAVIPVTTAPGAAVKPVEREVFVTVTNGVKGAAAASVSLTAPNGWTIAPAAVPLAFDKEDESRSARFVVAAPTTTKAGDYSLKAVVTSNASAGQAFSSGYQDIEYPHVERRQVIKAAETSVKVVPVRTAPNLNVGYMNGVGDLVPPAITQLGAKLSYIERDELAWGDLSKYDVIMTGVRAYERRDDLRAYNKRLIDYAERGGTVIVQYNKTEFNQAQYGPYPASVGSGRVADETAPVKILVPAHPVFTYPNAIGPSDWEHWVQERGLYFLGQKDPRYVDLISMIDTFPDNPGEKLGSLVEAKIGKGRWLYVGLALWRQLPAGTPGAYQLLANLISLPKAPAQK